MRRFSLPLITVVLLLCSTASAAVPSTITFQGRLTDDLGQPLDTTVAITFRIYAASSGGAALWTETLAPVVITDGLVDVLLGQTAPLSRAVFDGTTRWLSMAIGADPESATRLPITSTAYAIRANYADTSGRAVRAGYADTAAFALGVGNSGWIDDGANVRLVTPTDWLGIGTAAPEDKVHIENSLSGGTAFLRTETTHPTNWGETGLRFETPQNRWHFRMDDYTNNNIPDGALSLRSQDIGTEVMTWTSDGKVGILNTLPEYPLDVRSTAVAIYGRTTGGFGLAGVYGRAETTGFGVMGTSTDGRGVYGASTNGYGGYFLGPTTYVSGNLGIGTETPTHKLTVNGSEGFQSSGTTKYHVGYYGGGLDFCETGVADYRLMIEDGGEVGIGTANPTAKLHVMGNVKVRDTLTAGAMWSTSITDEPGVASVKTSSSISMSSSWQDVVSRQIVVPGPGYILAIGIATGFMPHTLGDTDALFLGLSDSTGSCASGTETDVYRSNWDATCTQESPMAVSTIFRADTAGTYRIYLVGRRVGPASCTIDYGQLNLLYVPTAYGTVSASVAGTEDDVADQSSDVTASDNLTANETAAPSIAELLTELAALREEVESLRNQIASNH